MVLEWGQVGSPRLVASMADRSHWNVRTVRTALHCSTVSTTHSVPRRYVGAWQNGVPHGRGNMTWADDDELITFGGQWRDGLPEGRGTMVYRLSPTQRWPIA